MIFDASEVIGACARGAQRIDIVCAHASPLDACQGGQQRYIPPLARELARCAPALLRGRHAVDAMLVVAGRPGPADHGAELAGLRQLTCQLGVAEHVLLIGPKHRTELRYPAHGRHRCHGGPHRAARERLTITGECMHPDPTGACPP